MKGGLISPCILEFLNRYAGATEEPDRESLGAMFASAFLSVDPHQVATVTPEQLLAALTHRQATLYADRRQAEPDSRSCCTPITTTLSSSSQLGPALRPNPRELSWKISI